MKFTVADLLDQLSPTEPLPLAKLEKALGLTSAADKQQLKIGLDGLVRLRLIEEGETGLGRLDCPDLVPARLRCSSKGFCFALRDDGGEDVYIRDHQLNHAWNGDRVLVRITRDGGRRRSPEGAVQCILERQTSSLLAQVEQQADRLLATPLDDRFLTSVVLPPEDATHLEPKQESVVEVLIDRFPVAQFPPLGHVARSLPVNGGPEADIDLLLTKHHLRDRPACPRSSLRAPAAKGREDLTALPTLMMDLWQGASAPGLPAVSLEERDGGWRLWVHAADISERLPLGSSLDRWIRGQTEAICLGDRWLPLLPPALARASAFEPSSTQAALSVALEINGEGTLEHFRFCRSLIKPDGRVDSRAMDALAERKPKARTLPAALRPLKSSIPMLEQLVALSTQLRSRRLAAGSIDLNLPMPALDQLGDLCQPPPDAALQGWFVELSSTSPGSVLRECVLMAHRALGRHLAALDLPALFATQAVPEAGEIHEVAKAALALELPLELSTDGDVSAAELATAFAATDRSRALQQQLRDCLRPVVLSDQPGGHALAGEDIAYAPWCCPGLHYADLWNQHVLVSLLTDAKDRPSVRHKNGVDLSSDQSHGAVTWPLLTPTQMATFQEARQHPGLLQRLNGRARFALDVQADVLALAQARHAEPLVGQILPGVISGVQSYGFFVEVPPSQVEGLVHVSSLKDDWYEYRSRQNRLVGRKGRRSYMVGDSVEVEIQNVDVLRHQIDLAVLQPEDGASGGSGDGEEEAGGDSPSATDDGEERPVALADR